MTLYIPQIATTALLSWLLIGCGNNAQTGDAGSVTEAAEVSANHNSSAEDSEAAINLPTPEEFAISASGLALNAAVAEKLPTGSLLADKGGAWVPNGKGAEHEFVFHDGQIAQQNWVGRFPIHQGLVNRNKFVIYNLSKSEVIELNKVGYRWVGVILREEKPIKLEFDEISLQLKEVAYSAADGWKYTWIYKTAGVEKEIYTNMYDLARLRQAGLVLRIHERDGIHRERLKELRTAEKAVIQDILQRYLSK